MSTIDFSYNTMSIIRVYIKTKLMITGAKIPNTDFYHYVRITQISKNNINTCWPGYFEP